MKIKVDRLICSGHAMCALKGPNVYELDEDGFNISDGRLVPAEHLEEARLGAAVCPEQAIALVDEA